MPELREFPCDAPTTPEWIIGRHALDQRDALSGEGWTPDRSRLPRPEAGEPAAVPTDNCRGFDDHQHIRPKTSLFHQVLEYLKTKSGPTGLVAGTEMGRQGVAAAAVTLRWGSYVCVLADHAKPLWAATRLPSISRISDDEMARINIEASAAMAEWIDIYQTPWATRGWWKEQ